MSLIHVLYTCHICSVNWGLHFDAAAGIEVRPRLQPSGRAVPGFLVARSGSE